MKATNAILTLCAMFVATLVTAEEPALPVAQVEKEHVWLKQFVGEWNSVSESVAAPGQPAMKCEGTMKLCMLGDLWVVSEVSGDMLGTQMNAIQTIGYDAKSKQYVGTWVDNVLNHMWQYRGNVDESGKILTLEAEGPDFADPSKTSKYRDVYEFKSKDHIVSTSQALGPDGKWIPFMTGNVRREK